VAVMPTSQRCTLPATISEPSKTPRRSHLAQKVATAWNDTPARGSRVHPFKKARTLPEKVLPDIDSITSCGKHEFDGMRHSLLSIQQAVWSRAAQKASRIGDLAWGQDGCPAGENEEIRSQCQTLAKRYASNRNYSCGSDDNIDSILEQFLAMQEPEACDSSDPIESQPRRMSEVHDRLLVERALTEPDYDERGFISELNDEASRAESYHPGMIPGSVGFESESSDTKMTRWLNRREQRKVRIGNKNTYGKVLRADHEQNLV